MGKKTSVPSRTRAAAARKSPPRAEPFDLTQAHEAVLDALPAHVALLDHRGVIVAVNSSWRAFASDNGMPGAGFGLGQNYLGVCENADGDCAGEAQAAAAGIRRILAGTQREFVLEYPCHGPAAPRWFRLMVTPLFDGKNTGAVVMHINITERKLAELELQERDGHLFQLTEQLDEERIRLVLAQAVAKVGSWQTDLKTLAVNWSVETHRIFGTDPATFHPTHQAFLELVHPEDRAAVEAAFVRSAGKWDPQMITHRLLLPGGRVKFIEERWQIFGDTQGRPQRALGTCQDITERRQAQLRLQDAQALLGMASRVSRLGAWQVELPDMKLTWSEEVSAIHGTPPGFTPPVADAINYYAPEFRERIRDRFMACVEQGTPFDEELQIITAKGRRVWVRSIGEAVRDDAGRITRVQGAFQDITERKQAETEVRRLAERLTTTLESMTHAFLTLDRNWCISYLNPEAERLVHRTKTDLLGRSIWTEFPDAVGSIIQREYERAVAEDTPVMFETYYPHPLDRWFEIRAYPFDEGLAVYFHDITEVREAREQLRLSEERFRKFLQSVPTVAIQGYATDGTVQYWNDASERFYGYSRDEALGRNLLDLIIPPEMRDGVRAALRDVAEGGDIPHRELELMRKDGSRITVFSSHAVVRRKGRPAELFCFDIDLSERKRAEQRVAEQAALLDKANDAILVRDLNHQILYWNHAAERLYGWPAAEAVGRSVQELLYETTGAFDQATATVLADGEWVGEIEQRTRDGRRVIVEGHWTLVRDQEGRPQSILAINADITERKRFEQQFLRAQRMESIGTLAGGIAHDLNNLLAPIVMGAGLLQRHELPESGREILRNIERGARRSTELVRQVLSFARGVEGERIALQLGHIVREIDDIVASTFPKNIVFETHVPKDLWLVMGDATQLNQVLLNLCVNARDAMSGGGQLTLTTTNRHLDQQYAATHGTVPAGAYVVIEVTDSGCGMNREVQDRIFEPFYTTKALGKGTGLGLSTVLGIVRSHGGVVTVQSEPGRGSAFRVWLPAHHDQGTEPSPAAAARPAPIVGHGELVLLVDDEAPVLAITRQTLETFGYRVLGAGDGAQAVGLYAVHQHEISAVLTDLMMPVMDGPMLIASLRRINPQVRLIAATGLSTSEYMNRAVALGVTHFLHKPYTAEELLATVHQVLTAPAPSKDPA